MDYQASLPIRTLVMRGLCRRCPMCGTGKLFTKWFKIKDRCPNCAILFEREEGSFVGAMFINIAVTEIALALFMAIGFAMTLPDPPTALLAVIGASISIVVPVFFYPYSKTIWTGVHLAMKPLEPSELADATAALFESDFEQKIQHQYGQDSAPRTDN